MRQIKVHGVTHNNIPADGGRSRQEVISEIYNSGREEITAELDYVNCKGGRVGVRIKDKQTNQVLGWLPKYLEEEFANAEERILTCKAQIAYHGVWHVSLMIEE